MNCHNLIIIVVSTTALVEEFALDKFANVTPASLAQIVRWIFTAQTTAVAMGCVSMESACVRQALADQINVTLRQMPLQTAHRSCLSAQTGAVDMETVQKRVHVTVNQDSLVLIVRPLHLATLTALDMDYALKGSACATTDGVAQDVALPCVHVPKLVPNTANATIVYVSAWMTGLAMTATSRPQRPSLAPQPTATLNAVAMGFATMAHVIVILDGSTMTAACSVLTIAVTLTASHKAFA